MELYAQSFIIIFATEKTFFFVIVQFIADATGKIRSDIKGFTQIKFTHIFWFTTHIRKIHIFFIHKKHILHRASRYDDIHFYHIFSMILIGNRTILHECIS